jgi:hypothetical protein
MVLGIDDNPRLYPLYHAGGPASIGFWGQWTAACTGGDGPLVRTVVQYHRVSLTAGARTAWLQGKGHPGEGQDRHPERGTGPRALRSGADGVER